MVFDFRKSIAGYLLFSAIYCALLNLPCISAENSAELIKKAWTEYGYREFSKAERFFVEAAQKAQSMEDYCQALSGQAFCYQFGKKAQANVDDYEFAISLYEKCLKKAASNPKFVPFLKSMIAECNYRIYIIDENPENFKKAQTIWNELQKKNYGSVIAQDALLYEVVIQTNDYGDTKSPINAKKLEEYVAPVLKAASKRDRKLGDEKLLTPVMANYLKDIYFWNNDFKKAASWLEAYIILGPTSYAARSDAYFRLARIAEKKLKDKKLAYKYYKRFYIEMKNSNRAYFAKEKMDELSKSLRKKK
jgi:hypothetical protein